MTPIKDLGNGLILRHASKDDAQALADFNGHIHSDEGWDKPDQRIAAWTRDLLSLPHPTLRPEDFTVIEETATRRIVSSLNLIPQTWAYEGIEFGVGRPELVGTLPEFRGRGLVRAQFDVIHKWCEERGYPVQAITGIPFFYRQFGYEMAMDMSGRRLGYEANLPKLKDGETEPYPIRAATENDLDFVASVYEEARERCVIYCKRTPEIRKYELNGQNANNINYFPMQIIEDLSGERVGYFQHYNMLGMSRIFAVDYELKAGVSWLDVSPSVVRFLWNKGQEIAARDHRECKAFGFLLGAQHPVYEAMGDALPSVRIPYAWYLRVPDLPAFLNHVKPALEKRLSESAACGHSCELKLSFYRDGLRFVIERGRITSIERWLPPANDDESDAAFPSLTFLQMVFGYRSFEELRHAFADCDWENNKARVVLNALFPKKTSDVFPLA